MMPAAMAPPRPRASACEGAAIDATAIVATAASAVKIFVIVFALVFVIVFVIVFVMAHPPSYQSRNLAVFIDINVGFCR
jgi:hypothetical protein